MPLLHVFEPAARIILATLFNSLWESALVAIAVWAVVTYVPNVNATTRYAAWCLALAGSLLLPLATAIPQITVQHPATASTRVATNVQVHAAKRGPAPATHHAPAEAPPPAAPLRFPGRPRVVLPTLFAPAIAALWGAVALFLIVRLIVNLWRLEALKRDALPIPPEYRESLARWAKAEKGAREIRLCTSDRVDVPVAVGLFDSMILIPSHLFETLSQGEMDQILLHELAHLRRADDWTNGLERVVQALFFFNPAILYIAAQLDLEREVACDDYVLRETGEVRPYANCLTKMAQVTAWPHRGVAAPGVFVTRRGLSVRVERLLRAGRNVRTSIAFGPAGAVAAALIVLVFVAETMAPSFAFTMPQVPAAPVHAVAVHHAVTHHAVAHHAVARSIAKGVQVASIALPTAAATVVSPFARAKSHAKAAISAYSAPPATRTSPASPPRPPAPPAHEVAAAAHGCIGCDFSGQNLAGHDFSNQRMTGADFSHANLQNARFRGSELTGSDFSGSNLRNADFTNARLNGCDMSHADLTGAVFTGAKIVGCDIDARRLSPAQAATLLRACASGCDFSGANLSGQDLRNMSIMGIDLSRSDLRNADLSGSRLSGVDLSGAQLAGARLNGTVFTGCSLDGIDFRNVDMSRAQVIGSKVTGTPPMR